MNVTEFLKSHDVPFELRHHPARYTAQEVAAAEHITGEDVAKVVIVKAGDTFVMCVLPATHVLDTQRVSELLGGAEVRLATEEEIAELFPDAEVGAMPPFGHEYDLPVLVEKSLAEEERVLIPAGTHEDSVLLAWQDFETLAEPELVTIGHHTA